MPEKQVHRSTQEAVLPYYSSPPSTHSGGSSAASSFDELAKGLASGTLSRGRALRLVAGALLGAVFGLLPRGSLGQ
jgi:hypothetical protein